MTERVLIDNSWSRREESPRMEREKSMRVMIDQGVQLGAAVIVGGKRRVQRMRRCADTSFLTPFTSARALHYHIKHKPSHISMI